MAGSSTSSRLIVGSLALGLTAALLQSAWAQSTPGTPDTTPEPPAVAKECGETNDGVTPLPNSALALQKRKQVKILAIGASSAAVLGVGRDGNPPLLEQILERNIKGLDVEIINRGFSGELADAAGERLRIEVALNQPDLVLWQVGTNDARAGSGRRLRALGRQHGPLAQGAQRGRDPDRAALHEAAGQDEHYQAIRTSLQRITAAENVLRITVTRRWKCWRDPCARAGGPSRAILV
jgi:lysophospholipase L1-like esterase